MPPPGGAARPFGGPAAAQRAKLRAFGCSQRSVPAPQRASAGLRSARAGDPAPKVGVRLRAPPESARVLRELVRYRFLLNALKDALLAATKAPGLGTAPPSQQDGAAPLRAGRPPFHAERLKPPRSCSAVAMATPRAGAFRLLRADASRPPRRRRLRAPPPSPRRPSPSVAPPRGGGVGSETAPIRRSPAVRGAAVGDRARAERRAAAGRSHVMPAGRSWHRPGAGGAVRMRRAERDGGPHSSWALLVAVGPRVPLAREVLVRMGCSHPERAAPLSGHR